MKYSRSVKLFALFLCVSMMMLFSLSAHAVTLKVVKTQTKKVESASATRAISMDAADYTVYVGEQIRAAVTVDRLTDDAPWDTQLKWTVSDETILNIYGNGYLNGRAPGKVTITATATDDESLSVSATVEVRVHVQSVAIQERNPQVLVGTDEKSAEIRLTVSVLPENAYFQNGTWTSSNEAIATVDKDGTVHGHAKGYAYITFTSDDPNHRSTQIQLRVDQSVESIQLDQDTVRVPIGRPVNLKATVLPTNASNAQLQWSSSDETIATVNAYGQITGKTVGNVTITAIATDGSGISAVCTATIVQPVKAITLSQQNVNLASGVKKRLTAVASPDTATVRDVVWSSSNEKVATVDEHGIVTGISRGSARITASATDGSGVQSAATVRVEAYDLVFTDTEIQQVTYTYGSGRFHITGDVKTGNVSIPLIDSLVMAAIVGGPAVEYVDVTPVSPGTDTITIKVGSKRFTYSVFVADYFNSSEDEYLQITDEMP